MGKTLAMNFDGVTWVPVENVQVDGGLHATHEGVWNFQGFAMRVYRLSDGRAVIHADDMNAFFDRLAE